MGKSTRPHQGFLEMPSKAEEEQGGRSGWTGPHRPEPCHPCRVATPPKPGSDCSRLRPGSGEGGQMPSTARLAGLLAAGVARLSSSPSLVYVAQRNRRDRDRAGPRRGQGGAPASFWVSPTVAPTLTWRPSPPLRVRPDTESRGRAASGSAPSGSRTEPGVGRG